MPTPTLTPEQRAATPSDVLAILDAMAASLNRYERLLQRSPSFSAWEWCGARAPDPDDCGAAFTTTHPMMHLIIVTLAEQLDASGAVNRVTIGGHHHRAGRIECVVQRVGRVSPADALRAAEEALGRAVTRLRALGEQWDEPLAFPPTPPVDADGDEARDPGRPWLRFDFRAVPNVHRCTRCGTVQAIPDPCTTEVWRAVAEAFAAEHEGCVEGDGEVGT